MYEKIFNFKFTPAGRGLWIAGTDYVDKHGSLALNNCAFASTDKIHLKDTQPFEWIFSALMCGTGCSFDVLGAGKITITKPQDLNPWTKRKEVFVIPDSREGWVEALRYKLKGYFAGKPDVIFDYSNIRPKGLPIKGFGGTSSGYEPLELLLNTVDNILNPLIGKKITETAIVDIMNCIAKAVVAGNVRRSAELVIGNIESEEFINLKNPELFQKELMSHRWASNNSVYAYVGTTNYNKIVDLIVKNGEPGIVWIDNCRNYSRMNNGPDYSDVNVMGVNPCAEITLESFELCNLVEMYPSKHDSLEEFLDTLKYAYLYSKSVTLINTESPETNAVMLKNRRIGVSMTGIIDAFAKFGRRNFLEEYCKRGYDTIRKYDKLYSDWLCIPKSVKVTTVKPSGHLSLLAGTSSGIHYPHSEYYIRRVRLSKHSDFILSLTKAGYHIEDDVYSPDNTVVVSFPVKTENYIKGKAETTMYEQLANAADLQRYWSDNSVSVTVTVKEDEIKHIVPALEIYEDKLKCVSFLPESGTSYQQMPYESITKEVYDEMVSKIKYALDFSSAQDESTGEIYCTTDSCELKEFKSKQ